MANIYKLNRREIEKIAKGDTRITRFIENLNDTEESIEISDTEGANANAKASQAIHTSDKAMKIAKNNRVLLWLSI